MSWTIDILEPKDSITFTKSNIKKFKEGGSGLKKINTLFLDYSLPKLFSQWANSFWLGFEAQDPPAASFKMLTKLANKLSCGSLFT